VEKNFYYVQLQLLELGLGTRLILPTRNEILW